VNEKGQIEIPKPTFFPQQVFFNFVKNCQSWVFQKKFPLNITKKDVLKESESKSDTIKHSKTDVKREKTKLF